MTPRFTHPSIHRSIHVFCEHDAMQRKATQQNIKQDTPSEYRYHLSGSKYIDTREYISICVHSNASYFVQTTHHHQYAHQLHLLMVTIFTVSHSAPVHNITYVDSSHRIISSTHTYCTHAYSHNTKTPNTTLNVTSSFILYIVKSITSPSPIISIQRKATTTTTTTSHHHRIISSHHHYFLRRMLSYRPLKYRLNYRVFLPFRPSAKHEKKQRKRRRRKKRTKKKAGIP